MINLKDEGLAEGDNTLDFDMVWRLETRDIPYFIDYQLPDQIVSGEEFPASFTIYLPYYQQRKFDAILTIRLPETVPLDEYLKFRALIKWKFLPDILYDQLGDDPHVGKADWIRFDQAGVLTAEVIGKAVTMAILAPLPPGTYEVSASVSSKDTHIYSGDKLSRSSYGFRYTSDLIKVGTVEILPQTENFWASPTSHYDPSGSWGYPERAYDWRMDRYASTKVDINEWSEPLELILDSPVLSDKARFNAAFNPNINDEIDLDVHRDGVWVDVYQGPFEDEVWVEKAFTQGVVDRARIRLRHTTKETEIRLWLYEFQLFCIEVI